MRVREVSRRLSLITAGAKRLPPFAACTSSPAACNYAYDLRSAMFKRTSSLRIIGSLNNGFSNLASGAFASPSISGGLLLDSSPCSLTQKRGIKVLGADVRVGNIVQRKGRTYQVIKAQHTQHGRGGASIQVELRDVDNANKVSERFRTDEAIERVFVEEKNFTYLYTEGNTVVLMDPETFDQIEVSKDLFGKAAAYLMDDMKVSVQYYDERPMFASVPTRVTCKVVEAQPPMKGLSVNPQYKRVVLNNGLTVLAPPFVSAGEDIIINTTDDSYITRAFVTCFGRVAFSEESASSNWTCPLTRRSRLNYKRQRSNIYLCTQF